jgi:tetratricopeptide (TPR) repeat protein
MPLSGSNLNPENADFTRAQQYLRDGNNDQAITLLKKIIVSGIASLPVYQSLAKSYEMKGTQEREPAFYKLAWDNYITAFQKDMNSAGTLDGIMRLATKLHRFDEFAALLKKALAADASNELLRKYLASIMQISMLSIPVVEQPRASPVSFIKKMLIDFLLPLAGIVLVLFGYYLPQYAPHARISLYAKIFLIIGIVLFSFYVIIKIASMPRISVRKQEW